MALETGTHISDLNAANPTSVDPLAQADDHLRLLKATIKASFPNISGAMTATHTVLNGLDGRVSAIENGVHASGTKMLFQQSTAPTGWTKDTTHNDKTLRVVTGTASSGGSNAFSSAFSSITPSGTVSTSVSGTVANHTLTVDQIPSHTHTISGTYRKDAGSPPGGNFPHGSAHGTSGVNISGFLDLTNSNTGGGQAHNHGFSGSATSTFTGSSINLDVQYVDVIIASKD